jgi:hypothetical protein
VEEDKYGRAAAAAKMEDGTLGKLAREENPRVTFTNAI